MTTTNTITATITDQTLLSACGGAAHHAETQRIIGGQGGIGPAWTWPENQQNADGPLLASTTGLAEFCRKPQA